MHVDTGHAHQWGDPFPPRATRSGRTTRFAQERLRESLNASRTMEGGGAAGVATLGAAGVDVAQDVLADTQSAIQTLILWLDSLRWMFIAMALIGIGTTIYASWDAWRKGRR